MFRGTFTALVTPFRNGGIDDSAFKKLIETQIAAAITGIVAIGTTGESPTLSHEEREQAQTPRNTLWPTLGSLSNLAPMARCLWRRITTNRVRKGSSAISKQSPTPHRCRSCSTTFPDAAA